MNCCRHENKTALRHVAGKGYCAAPACLQAAILAAKGQGSSSANAAPDRELPSFKTNLARRWDRRRRVA